MHLHADCNVCERETLPVVNNVALLTRNANSNTVTNPQNAVVVLHATQTCTKTKKPAL